jgi:hypothetical protein
MRSWRGGDTSRRGLAGWRDHTSLPFGISAQRKNGSPDISQARQGEPLESACRGHHGSCSRFRKVGSNSATCCRCAQSSITILLSLQVTNPSARNRWLTDKARLHWCSFCPLRTRAVHHVRPRIDWRTVRRASIDAEAALPSSVPLTSVAGSGSRRRVSAVRLRRIGEPAASGAHAEGQHTAGVSADVRRGSAA